MDVTFLMHTYLPSGFENGLSAFAADIKVPKTEKREVYNEVRLHCMHTGQLCRKTANIFMLFLFGVLQFRSNLIEICDNLFF